MLPAIFKIKPPLLISFEQPEQIAWQATPTRWTASHSTSSNAPHCWQMKRWWPVDGAQNFLGGEVVVRRLQIVDNRPPF
jgi:hypothetical protein